MALLVRTMPNSWLALGLAAHFVAKREPFSRFVAGDLIRTLSAQIRRGHYLFALDDAADPARVVGYFGWAVYDQAVAERFAATGVAPDDSLASGRDVVWILTAAAEDRGAFFALARAGRALYPTQRVMGIRHKPNRRRVAFDQSRARVKARLAAPRAEA